MNDQLAALVNQLRDLSQQDRAEVLRALLGTGLLPEATEDRTDEPPVYMVQGCKVDQETFEFMHQTTGIFSVEKLGMSPQRVIDALEAEQAMKRVKANLEAILPPDERGYGGEHRLMQELRDLGDFLGVKTRYAWETPSAEVLKAAIVRKVKPALTLVSDAVVPVTTLPDPEKLSLSDSLVVAFMDETLPVLAAHFINGEDPDIAAKELAEQNDPEAIHSVLEMISIEDVLVRMKSSGLYPHLESEEAQHFLRDVWEKLRS